MILAMATILKAFFGLQEVLKSSVVHALLGAEESYGSTLSPVGDVAE